jgi:hypothetical protein
LHSYLALIEPIVKFTSRNLFLTAGVVVSISIGLCIANYFTDEQDTALADKSATDTGLTELPHDAGARHMATDSWGLSPFASGALSTSTAQEVSNTKAKAAMLFGRNGREMDFEGLTAAQYIAKWSVTARTGNKEAAYKTYQAESVCANKDEPLAEYATEVERGQALREKKELANICEGVSLAQVQERMQFLTLAAQAGNTQAKIDFYMEGPSGQSANPADGADDPGLQQWKESAVKNLQEAAAHGEPFALALLAQNYYSGELTPSDLKMSLTYTVADEVARNVTLSPTQLRSRFGAQMSDADFQNALQSGEQIANECCRK